MTPNPRDYTTMERSTKSENRCGNSCYDLSKKPGIFFGGTIHKKWYQSTHQYFFPCRRIGHLTPITSFFPSNPHLGWYYVKLRQTVPPLHLSLHGHPHPHALIEVPEVEARPEEYSSGELRRRVEH